MTEQDLPGAEQEDAPDAWGQLLVRLERLREPFPPQSVSLRQGNDGPIPYVGHAETTDRLLSTDAGWTWEPFALDTNGAPLLERDGQNRPIGLWIRLTVCGVTRPGYGSCPPTRQECVKELIGDAIRNAAMRFGVALDLWAKGELESGYRNCSEHPGIAHGDFASSGAAPVGTAPSIVAPTGATPGTARGAAQNAPFNGSRVIYPNRVDWRARGTPVGREPTGDAPIVGASTHGVSVRAAGMAADVNGAREASEDAYDERVHAEQITEIQRATIFAFSISLWPDKDSADVEIARLLGKRPDGLNRAEAEAAIARLKQLQDEREARSDTGRRTQGSLDGTLACFNAYGQL